MKRRDVYVNHTGVSITVSVFPRTENGEVIPDAMRTYATYSYHSASHRARRALRGMRLLSAALKREFKLRGEL